QKYCSEPFHFSSTVCKSGLAIVETMLTTSRSMSCKDNFTNVISRHMTSSIRRLQPAMIDILDLDSTIWWEIFAHLHPLDLHFVRAVCKTFWEIINSDQFGKFLFKRRFGHYSLNYLELYPNPTYWPIYIPIPGRETDC